MDINSVKKLIRVIKNFPKKGILFYDITPIFANASAFSSVLNKIEWSLPNNTIKRFKIVCPESRGFILGSAIADRMKLPLILIRKQGKLPGPTYNYLYNTEYSSQILCLQVGAIKKGDKIILIDDILATGGTLKACASLVEKSGGKVVKIITLARIGKIWEKAIKNLGKYGYLSIIPL